MFVEPRYRVLYTDTDDCATHIVEGDYSYRDCLRIIAEKLVHAYSLEKNPDHMIRDINNFDQLHGYIQAILDFYQYHVVVWSNDIPHRRHDGKGCSTMKIDDMVWTIFPLKEVE